MSYVTIIWSVIASGALLLALMYGCVWVMDRKARASLAFAFESLSIVGMVIVELGMMNSSSPEEWGEWVRWNQVPILLRTAGTGEPVEEAERQAAFGRVRGLWDKTINSIRNSNSPSARS